MSPCPLLFVFVVSIGLRCGGSSLDLAELIRDEVFIEEERENETRLEIQESFVDLEGNAAYKPNVENSINPLEDRDGLAEPELDDTDKLTDSDGEGTGDSGDIGQDRPVKIRDEEPDEAWEEYLQGQGDDEEWVPPEDAEIEDLEDKISNDTEYGRRDHDKRKVLFNNRLWPNGVIPWKFSTKRGSMFRQAMSKNMVRRVMKVLVGNTCLKFEEYPRSGKKEPKNTLVIGSGNGCRATVGYMQLMKDMEHRMTLKENGCIHYGTVMHELGHVIGLIHEHMRTDRERYIDVREENTERIYLPNFSEWKQSQNLARYDLASNMHYGGQAFSTNGMNTIVVKDPELQFLIGRRGEMSFYDIKAINKAYNCHKKCQSPVFCQNDGFLVKDCKCHCPDGLSGQTCGTIDRSKTTGCGDVIHIGLDEKRIIKSPKFPNGALNTRCTWLITVDTGYRIHLTISKVNMARLPSHECKDWLEVRYNLLGQTGPRFCGHSSEKHKIITSSNTSLLVFRGILGGRFKVKAKIDEASIIEKNSFVCSFENNNWGGCPFSKSDQGDFDWRIGRKGTRSAGTGPSWGANKTIYYLYVESSNPRIEGDEAVIHTGYLKGGIGCFSFFYNMNGKTMGRLWVTVVANNSEYLTPFDKSGHQGKGWKIHDVFIASENEYKIVTTAKVGSSFTSDFAIDQLRFRPVACTSSSFSVAAFGTYDKCTDSFCKHGGQCYPSSLTNRQCVCRSVYVGEICQKVGSLITGPTHCSFDELSDDNISKYCIFDDISSGSLSWKYSTYVVWKSRKIGNKGTFLMASGGLQASTAVLQSFDIKGGSWCLELTLIFPRMKQNEVRIELLDLRAKNLQGTQLKTRYRMGWQTYRLNIFVSGDFKVMVTAAMVPESIVAIDTLHLEPGTCRNKDNVIHLTNQKRKKKKILKPYFCTFDKSACDFANKARATMDWVLVQKDRKFGPLQDHTGHKKYYLSPDMFYQGSVGSVARADTPAIEMDGVVCIKFYLYFFGHKFGSLGVYVISSESTPRSILLMVEDATATVSLNKEWTEKKFEKKLKGKYRIEFYFTMKYFFGSVGIDDVSVTHAKCKKG